MRRLAMGMVLCLVAAVGALLPRAQAFADPECMFYIDPGMGAEAQCPQWTQSSTGGPGTVSPADDRINSTPTAWWTYYGVGPDTVSNLLNTNGARPTDLRVLSTSPLLFAVTMVRNSGAYTSGYWWYYGVSMNQVGSFLSANNARLISAVRYGSVYAVVMVPNTGPNARAWGWCDTDFAGIGTCLGSGSRLTNIEGYASNRFVVIFVANSEHYGWCWYAGISRTGLDNVCGGQSVLDVSANPDGTFNVASVAAPVQDALGDFGTVGDAVTCALDNGNRPLFTVPYQSGGATRWLASFAHDS